MNMLTKAVAAASFLGAMALVGAASAETYTFNDDHCTGTCGASSYGTLVTSGEGTTSVTFTVTLTGGNTFNSNGNGIDTFAWSFVGDPSITISSLSANFTASGAQSAGSHHEDGTGDWDYILNTSTAGLTSLTFTVTSGSNLTLAGHTAGGPTIFAEADLLGVNGNTGAVGASTSLVPHVPEPASWALMLTGVGLVGFSLRRRRETAKVAI